VGARKVVDYEQLAEAMRLDSSLIIQEFMNCLDLDADVYIDTISHQAVAAFSKKKIETRIGGASKTISFKDPALFEFISKIVATLKFNGPVDMDFFYRDGKYYLSEVNPRFGGAYLHAYGAGVDFIKLIENNLHGIANKPSFGEYDEGVVMLMYDSVVIRKPGELAE
jgi:carbamoyl-phosphate synthase large subunit